MPVFEGDLVGGGADDGAGVVDEDVDAAEGGYDLGEEVLGAVVAERSAWKAWAVPPAALMASAVSVAGRRLPWHGDGGSGLGECGGDGGAEAGGCSGDEGDFVVEAEEVECVLHG